MRALFTGSSVGRDAIEGAFQGECGASGVGRMGCGPGLGRRQRRAPVPTTRTHGGAPGEGKGGRKHHPPAATLPSHEFVHARNVPPFGLLQCRFGQAHARLAAVRVVTVRLSAMQVPPASNQQQHPCYPRTQRAAVQVQPALTQHSFTSIHAATSTNPRARPRTRRAAMQVPPSTHLTFTQHSTPIHPALIHAASMQHSPSNSLHPPHPTCCSAGRRRPAPPPSRPPPWPP